MGVSRSGGTADAESGPTAILTFAAISIS